MNKIAIIGDTSQDLNFEMGETFGIEVLPYYLQMGDKHYKDLVEINSKKFYDTMHEYKVLSTGIPPIQDVEDKLEFLRDEGYEDVIIVTSSEKITGMYAMCGTIKSYYKGLNLHLFDAGQIGAATGLFTIRAAEFRNQGKSVEDILLELNRVKDKTNIFALFRTLSYLVKGGRFNKYKGILGNLLNVKPLLSVLDGEITVRERHRGMKRSLNAFVSEIKNEVGNSKKYRLIIFSGKNEKEKIEIKKQLKQIIDGADLYLETEFTSVLGVHAGPESIGAAIMLLD
ncbi:MAG: DegV family protein [Peptoniphilaceae bacterium]